MDLQAGPWAPAPAVASAEERLLAGLSVEVVEYLQVAMGSVVKGALRTLAAAEGQKVLAQVQWENHPWTKASPQLLIKKDCE